MPRQKRLREEDEKTYRHCLAVPDASEEAVRQIWNILQDDDCQLAKSTGNELAKRLRRLLTSCYRQHLLPGSRGTEKVLIADLQCLLQAVCDEAPPFAAALRGLNVENQSGNLPYRILTLILYNDEATAGNVLSAAKELKAALFYLSFRELGSATLKQEDSWLPVGLVLHEQLERLSGNLSGYMRELVLQVFAPLRLSDGFELSIAGETCRFKLAPSAYFLADNDAVRGTFLFKGSAGNRYCSLCNNAWRRSDGPAGFHTCAEGDIRKFCLATDSDVAEAVATLRREALHGNKKSLQELEKTLGFKYSESRLLFDEKALACLPVSNVCNDVMHCYYSNGCANWEIRLLLEVLDKVNLSFQKLGEACCSGDWTGPKHSSHSQQNYLQRLWQDCLLGSEGYKGQSQQTQSFLPLLDFYVHELLQGRALLLPARTSWAALMECHRLLRHVHYLVGPPSRAWQRALERAQHAHALAFVAAYGAGETKPKHHYRLHLPAHLVHLQCGLHTETHESKHRCYKNRLAKAHANKINTPCEIALAVLPRMMHEQCERIVEKATLDFNLLLPPVQEVAAATGCKRSNGMRLDSATIHVTDVVFMERTQGVVDACLQDSEGFMLLFSPLRLLHKKPWGAVFIKEPGQKCIRVSPSNKLTLPSWWRVRGSNIDCLF